MKKKLKLWQQKSSPKKDVEAFEQRLFQKIEQVLGGNTPEPKKWLKSYQVKNMLRISPGTLQTLRVNGTLPTLRSAASFTINRKTS